MTRDNTIAALLETFQECTSRGENAMLFLETRNGVQFANLRVKLPASTSDKTFLGSTAKKKSPSTLKRDKVRLVNYLKKKSLQDSWKLNATSTPATKAPPFPASCSLVLETPKEVSCENGSVDCRAGDQDAEMNSDSEKKQTTQRLSQEDRLFLENLIDKSLNKFDNLLEKTDDTLVENDNDDDEINEDDSEDNIEAAKKWTMQQKLSLSNRKS